MKRQLPRRLNRQLHARILSYKLLRDSAPLRAASYERRVPPVMDGLGARHAQTSTTFEPLNTNSEVAT
jgi:hypothetical protein